MEWCAVTAVSISAVSKALRSDTRSSGLTPRFGFCYRRANNRRRPSSRGVLVDQSIGRSVVRRRLCGLDDLCALFVELHRVLLKRFPLAL
jgi:hypothetical protein